MNAEEMGILFTGISSILAVLIYFTKNIKKSSCMGSTCEQAVQTTTVLASVEEPIDNISIV